MIALLVLLAFFGVWQAYCALSGIDPFVLPAPDDVARSLVHDRGLLLDQFLVSAQVIALGLLLAVVVASALAVLLHLFTQVRLGLMPLFIASQAVPIPVLAPVLVTWLGFGLVPKVVLVGLVSFFPIVVPMLDRLQAVEGGQLKVLRSLGASRWQVLRHVELPAALPGAFTGARLAVAYAAVSAFIAESAGSEAGLGHLVIASIPQLETARALAAVVVLAAASVILYALLGLAERRLLPWAHPARSRP